MSDQIPADWRPNGVPDGRRRQLLALADGMGRGKRWRGRLAVPTNAHPLVRELFEIMNEQHVAMRDAGKRAGVQFATISDWRYRANPSIVTLGAVLNVLGYELKIVKRKGE